MALTLPLSFTQDLNHLSLIYVLLAVQFSFTFQITYARSSIDVKCRKGIFVGYSEESKAYRVWDSDKRQVVTTRDLVFDEQAFLKIHTSTEVPSLTSHSPPQVLIPDIPPPSHNPDIPPLTPLASPSSHNSVDADRELIVDIPVHPIDEPPLNQSVSDPLIVPEETSLSSAPNAPVNSSNQSTSLGHRPINPPNRYGDWHYSFTAMAGTLPPVPKSYEEAINSPRAWMLNLKP
jgi:hypothetical protein